MFVFGILKKQNFHDAGHIIKFGTLLSCLILLNKSPLVMRVATSYVEKVLKLSHTHNSPLVARVATNCNALRVLHDIPTI